MNVMEMMGKELSQIIELANANLKYLPNVYNVQGFGAKADAATDAAPAINKAIAEAQASGYEAIIWIPAGRYLINSPIIIKHGTVQHNINIMGYGAQLIAGTVGMSCIKVVALSSAGFAYIGLTRIMGLRIYGSGDANSVGIYLGKDSSAGYGIDGTYPSLIRDVTIENCKTGVIASDTRLFQMENVHVQGGPAGAIGFLFQSIYDGFTGDCWMTNCQAGAASDGYGLKIVASTLSTGSRLTGIHVTDCVFYGPGVNISATSSPSKVEDIWITSCVADGQVIGNGISITGVAGTGVGNIFIDNFWVNAFQNGIFLSGVAGVKIIGGKASSTTFAAVDVENCNDCSLLKMDFNDVNKSGNGGGCVKLGGIGARNRVESCNFTNTGAYGNQFILIEANQTKPIVRGNVKDSAGAVYVNNVAGTEGTNFIVAGNL